MTYAAASDMRRSASLKGRIESAASAHGQGIAWVDQNIAALCATDGWAAKWRQARMDAFEDGDDNRDIGVSINVITDDMIDTAITGLLDNASAPDQPTAANVQTIAMLQLQVQQLQATVDDLKAQAATPAADVAPEAQASDEATA